MHRSMRVPVLMTAMRATLLVSRFLALRFLGTLGSASPFFALVFLSFSAFSSPPSAFFFFGASSPAPGSGSDSGAGKTVPHLGHSTSVPASGATFRRSLVRQSGHRSSTAMENHLTLKDETDVTAYPT